MLTVDWHPFTIMRHDRPVFRIMWMIGSMGVSAGAGDCYGWRWFVCIGRMLVLIGRARNG